MSFPPYDRYKRSRTEGLESIPCHWDELPLKYLATLKGRLGWQGLRAEEYTEVGPCLVTSAHFSNDRIDWEQCFHVPQDRYEMAPEIQLRQDDLLMMKDGAAMGKLAYVDELPGPACLNSHLLLFRPIRGNITNRFLYYMLGSPYFESYMHRARTGTTFFGISQESIGEFRQVVPPIDEQQAIVDFLDAETVKIDALVAEQRRLIELLQEKRQAVISHAVTKGLNPNAPMKPSGIPWLGDVPAHWDTARVKFASHRISKGDTPSNFGMDFAVDGPVRFIKIENIGEGQLIENPRYSIEFEAHDQLKRSQLKANDIVFAIAGATTGKCAIILESHLPANTNQAVAYIRPNDRGVPMFLVAWLQSRELREAMWETTVKSAQPNLSMENLGNLPLLIPPTHEQELIVREVEVVGGRFLGLIAEAERAIELLQERRTALISAAVTGKIDVRGYGKEEAA